MATFFLHKAPRETKSAEPACRELERRYGDLDWIVPELLDRCRSLPTIYFDAVEQIQMPRWSNGACAHR